MFNVGYETSRARMLCCKYRVLCHCLQLNMATCETFILSNFYRFAPSCCLLASVPVGWGKANMEHVTSGHALKVDVRLDLG